MMKKLNLILAVLFLSSVPGFAQMRQANVSFYGGDMSGGSYGTLVKTDLEGNYFCAGRSNGQYSKFDFALIKYSPSGNLLWENRFNGEGNGDDTPFGLLVDKSGCTYITGTSEYTNKSYPTECVTIKYSPGGKQLWINKYRSAGRPNSHGQSIVMDAEGSIYLAGYTGTKASHDVLIMKISHEGETIWTRIFTANSFSADYNNIIALHKDNIYICGGIVFNNPHYIDYLVVKYDVNGNYIWDRSYNGNHDNSFDMAKSIFVDNNENVYVTGYTENVNTILDITTLKYNSDGDLLWATPYNGSGDGYDWSNHVIADDAGNVYVEGGTQNERETDPECHAELGKCRNDATLIKYLPSGIIEWVRLYNGPDNMYDCLQGMTMDNENNIYVAGRSHSEESATNDDIITMKYNSDGQMIWFMKYNSGQGRNDYGNAIALDGKGNVFTSGWSDANGPNNFIVVKYSAAQVVVDAITSLNLDNFPNPFNPSTNISFNLANSSFVKLTVYDIAGRQVRTLLNEKVSSGNHSYRFEAGNLNSGVYFYKLETISDNGERSLMTKKMILLK